MLRIKLIGDEEVRERLAHIIRGKASRFGKALNLVAAKIATHAKREGFQKGRKGAAWTFSDKLHAPTGRLRASIIHQLDQANLRAYIGSNVVYARIHELGGMAGRGHSVKIPARPYLQPALEANRAAIAQLFAFEIDKLLDGR